MIDLLPTTTIFPTNISILPPTWWYQWCYLTTSAITPSNSKGKYPKFTNLLIHRINMVSSKPESSKDCLAWSLDYRHSCHQSKKEILILKLDFEKTFNEHELMIQILIQNGFPSIWINWMRVIFSSDTSYVLLNGVLEKIFHCTWGVSLGDPLSPLLFVLVAYFHQTTLNVVKDKGLLLLPIHNNHDNDFLILQYADDTLIFMKVDAKQLFFLKALLNSFAYSFGVRVNFNKFMMVTINVHDSKLQVLAQTFGHSIDFLPFTYFGLPLALTRPSITDFLPLVNKCECWLVTISSFLSQTGRLQLTNSILSALPTYTMCIFLLPKTY